MKSDKTLHHQPTTKLSCQQWRARQTGDTYPLAAYFIANGAFCLKWTLILVEKTHQPLYQSHFFIDYLDLSADDAVDIKYNMVFGGN
jgi:hypothetical protein